MSQYLITYDVPDQFRYVKGDDGQIRERQPLLRYFSERIRRLFREQLKESSAKRINLSVYFVSSRKAVKEFQVLTNTLRDQLRTSLMEQMQQAQKKKDAAKYEDYERRYKFLQSNWNDVKPVVRYAEVLPFDSRASASK